MPAFTLNPGQTANLTFKYKGSGTVLRVETNIDLLIQGTYVDTIEGRIAKRLSYRNSVYNDQPLSVINTTDSAITYELRGCIKLSSPRDDPSQNPFSGLLERDEIDPENGRRRFAFYSEDSRVGTRAFAYIEIL